MCQKLVLDPPRPWRRVWELLDSDAKPLLRYLSWSLGVKLRCESVRSCRLWEHSEKSGVLFCWLDILMCNILRQFITSILSALQQNWFVLPLWTASLTVAQKPQAFDVGIGWSFPSIRFAMKLWQGMAGAKSLLLFWTLVGSRKVLSQLGDLSIDSRLCWSLWIDRASEDHRLLVDDCCGVFRATTAWSTCGLSSGYDYGSRASGAPISPACPDIVQGWTWTQDHLGLVWDVCILLSATALLRPSQKGGREAEGPGGVSKGDTSTNGTDTIFGWRWGGRGTWHESGRRILGQVDGRWTPTQHEVV